MVPYQASRCQPPTSHEQHSATRSSLKLKLSHKSCRSADYGLNRLVEPLSCRSSILILLTDIGSKEPQQQKKSHCCHHGQTSRFHQEVSEILVLRLSISSTDPHHTCRVRQLRRYLIEIVALTLDADFDALNIALYNEKYAAKTNSILSATKREELRVLSNLVRKVHDRFVRDESIEQNDQQHLRDVIIESAMDIDPPLLGLYALDLIAWYGEPGSGVREVLSERRIWSSETWRLPQSCQV
jgi:hypothetical protein